GSGFLERTRRAGPVDDVALQHAFEFGAGRGGSVGVEHTARGEEEHAQATKLKARQCTRLNVCHFETFDREHAGRGLRYTPASGRRPVMSAMYCGYDLLEKSHFIRYY